MTLWEKLTHNPDFGPWIRAPLPAAIAGAALVFLTLRSMALGVINLGKGPNANVLHWSDSPKVFALICVVDLVLAFAVLSFARRQFLKHDR